MVFWDVDECAVPDGKTVAEVAENIKKALAKSGLTGDCSMIAYGDTSQIMSELAAAEITPIQAPYPREDKNSRVADIRSELWRWVLDHRFERYSILLILGDVSNQFEFSRYLFKIKGSFNVLLAVPQSTKGMLLAVGNRVWFWSDLADGEPPISEHDKQFFMKQKVHYVD